MPDLLISGRPKPELLTEASPGLRNGDHLDQPTFHALYGAMPEDFRAELIEGIVFIPFSVSTDHAGDHSVIAFWSQFYSFATPGTRTLLDPTFILGPKNEPQPDVALIVLPEYGGQTRKEGGFAAGAPELVAEVAYSSYAYDLHSKKRAYEAAGVRDYLVLNLAEKRLEWFALVAGRFEAKAPSGDGLLRSENFPGLWLDPVATMARDGAGVTRALQRGLDSPEHAAFAEQLRARATGQ